MVETLVAMGLLVTVLAGLAALPATSLGQTLDAGRDLSALAMAQAKLESLRAVAWTYDAAGARLSDPALALSPASALERTTPGYSDWLDESGRPTTGVGPAAWLRRWAIRPVDASGLDLIVIEVCALRSASLGSHGPQAPVCLGTIRSRQP